MRHTLVATFERHVDAQSCALRLEQGGLPAGSVSVTERSEAQAHEAPHDRLATYLHSFFAEVFGPQPHAHTQLLHAGGALVRVDVADEAALDAARRTLRDCGATSVEEHPQG